MNWTKADSARLRELAKKATPGPWVFDRENFGKVFDTNYGVYSEPDPQSLLARPTVANIPCKTGEHDAAFLSAARTDVPRLLAHVEELEKTFDEFKGLTFAQKLKISALEAENEKLSKATLDMGWGVGDYIETLKTEISELDDRNKELNRRCVGLAFDRDDRDEIISRLRAVVEAAKNLYREWKMWATTSAESHGILDKALSALEQKNDATS